MHNLIGHNGGPLLNDAQALAFVQGQAYKVNQTVYEARFPDWDYARLVFVDTSGPAWSPGVLTYTSDLTGKANWQSGAAKDIPLADVSQDMQLSTFHLAAIGYQYNIEEVNAAIQVGASLPSRRARAAKLAYTKFMWDLTIAGSTEKGKAGLINNAGITAAAAAADGTGSARHWMANDGTVTKTAQQIMRDINQALTGTNVSTNTVEWADTVLLPVEAFNLISSTPFNSLGADTILSWLLRTNNYTLTTGRPLTIRAMPQLRTASTQTVVGGGRLVAYKNDQNYVKLNLPMPHQFLPVYQDGPLNWQVPGIFRTGGLDFQTLATFYYLDGILPAPA
ncbi:hypothetical protein ASE63_22375 [Bosea sp. Root381]|uniref:DUF2184 domain-containing protein n=1 Tax=Bosea sp. Root381 TaxID=1736524 RepID=UPI0006F9B0D0|nr:DUF2184 domain-containing protein [Bosea sp. Root381]KRE07448.1 hypothetical protein ASE63_22375 [Bosea sp. Root381]